MAIKNNHKKSPAAVLSSVAAEMVKPRVAESTKTDADTVANGGHGHANLFLRNTRIARTKYSVIRGRETDHIR